MILTGIPCASPELAGGVGSRVPDYRERFLRGLQSGHSVGQTVANSIKSHNHTQPTHTHSFSGQLVSTALSGTAGNPSLLRQISESAGGLPDNPSRAEERVDKHIRQYKAQGEHGFPSAKLEMIRESLEAEFLFNERLKKH